ncbi:FMN-dependent alpha-hydroxy acid dehydrogenase [uncultured delta proteobacterium]|uniref:FMN-dependent alpha-hydroxy acid dehydrogenase n=1 Tax=uncultured delta proteobacterium TaxID=34034 RepID=A0A212JYF1_9DELT|nr:FMN-dependent alpha-hydroxy acid dehydrogenase [uncultured delta proteobacterium]
MTIQEIRSKARERVKTRCRVCPVCDGKACAGEVPGMGGIGTGMGFRNNVTALASWRLNMRVLHDANSPDTGLELWGRKLSLPVFAAPVGTVGRNLGSGMPDEEYVGHLIHGCVAAGTLASTGDVPDIEMFRKFMAQVKGRGKSVVPFIKPWNKDAVAARFDVAREAGCDICGMDVDAAGLTILRTLAAPVSVKTPGELAEIIALAHQRGMKFIVKGIMTVDEAEAAAEAGADAIIVSNHGGRVLDWTPGTAEVLPEIAETVGDRTVVMVDGGIRTGADVLKVLALGAKAALICRPVAVMLHGDEEGGVPAYFAGIQDELAQAMRLTGCHDLASIDANVVC